MSRGCCCVLLLALVAAVSGVVVDVKKKVGSKAVFKPDITEGTSLKDSSITWTYKAGGDVINVIEWDNDFQTLESLNPKFKTRVALDRTTGELTIRDLQLEHNGLYTIEINNKELYKRFTLTVKEGVPKPKLIREETSDDDVMYLTCEYNTMIRWACSHGEKPQITKLAKPRQGEFITFKRTENQDVCCTCTLFNDVSEKTSDPLCEKDLFYDLHNPVVYCLLSLGIVSVITVCGILFWHYCCKPRLHKDTSHLSILSSFFSPRDS